MRTVEISTPGARVGAQGGRLIIDRPDLDSVGVAVDDLDLLVLEVPGVAVTGGALAALAAAGVPAMVCNAAHQPVGWVHPLVTGASVVAERAVRQAALSRRTRDRLWSSIVRAKILRQADVLADCGGHAARLVQLARTVAPGDPANVEATAAQIYWPGLFGDRFRRHGDDPRSQILNYGYAVLRAIFCRALVAAGLHPALPIHHSASGNPFALADDLMEPYRPLVDREVSRFASSCSLDAAAKACMAAIGELPCRVGNQRMRCRAAVAETVSSLARIIDAGRGNLALPRAFGETPDA